MHDKYLVIIQSNLFMHMTTVKALSLDTNEFLESWHRTYLIECHSMYTNQCH